MPKPTKDWSAIFKRLSRANRAWLGGLFDGEGCIQISRLSPATTKRAKSESAKYAVRVTIGNTDPGIIKRVCELTDMHASEGRATGGRRQRMYYQIRLYGLGAYEFLRSIRTFLAGCKGPQADCAIKFQASKNDRRYYEIPEKVDQERMVLVHRITEIRHQDRLDGEVERRKTGGAA